MFFFVFIINFDTGTGFPDLSITKMFCTGEMDKLYEDLCESLQKNYQSFFADPCS